MIGEGPLGQGEKTLLVVQQGGGPAIVFAQPVVEEDRADPQHQSGTACVQQDVQALARQVVQLEVKAPAVFPMLVEQIEQVEGQALLLVVVDDKGRQQVIGPGDDFALGLGIQRQQADQ